MISIIRFSPKQRELFIESARRAINVLIIDISNPQMSIVYQYLLGEGINTGQVAGHEEAVKHLKKKKYDLLIAEINSKEEKAYVEKYSTLFNAPTLVITDSKERNFLLSLIKAGAFDIINKPVNLVRFNIIFEKYIKQRDNGVKKDSKTPASSATPAISANIIGTSKEMQRIFKEMESVAKTSTSLLITGETGTGKDVISQAIHELSPRRDGHFMAINCSSIPHELLESELFGYEKGAFSGAYTSKRGLFELSSEGTLFLDEIGDLPYDLQAKLLRVLEERSIRRLGSTTTIPIDFRLIAATNQELPRLVKEKRFRKDLYFRLNVFHIHLPPLKERKEDILPLAYYFIDRFNRIHGKEVKGLSEHAEHKILRYSFPGNIRELEHIIEKAIIISSEKTLGPKDILFSKDIEDIENVGGISNITINIEQPMKTVVKYWKDEIIREYLENLIRKYGWDIKTIIKISGIDRSYFYKLVKKYELMEKYSTKWNISPHS